MAVFCTFPFTSLLSLLLQLLFLLALLLHLFLVTFLPVLLHPSSSRSSSSSRRSNTSNRSNQVVKNSILDRRLSFHWPLRTRDIFI